MNEKIELFRTELKSGSNPMKPSRPNEITQENQRLAALRKNRHLSGLMCPHPMTMREFDCENEAEQRS